MQMVLTGDPIDAATALRYGLVQAVVPGERLYAEAEAIARRMASLPEGAVAAAKRALAAAGELSLREAARVESKLAERLAQQP